MYLGNNAAIRGCQEYFNRCAAAGSPIGATQTPSSYDNAASFNGTGRNNSTTSATSRVSQLIAMAPGIGMTASRMAQIHALYRLKGLPAWCMLLS
jgi:hypothetical protein